MRKNKGDKRHEITPEQITKIATIYNKFEEGPYCKIFETIEFGFRKIRVERPLRLNFQVAPERLEKLEQEPAFKNLTESSKDTRKAKTPEEIAQGEQLQQSIRNMLRDLGERLYYSRPDFKKDLNRAAVQHKLPLSAPIYKAILSALSERDETADICYKDDKGKDKEPDPALRDHENLPLDEAKWSQYDEKIPLREKVLDYLEREVKAYISDAYLDEKYIDEQDGDIGRVGYEINFTRYFYHYQKPRSLEVIDQEIKQLEKQILDLLAGVE